MILAFTLMEVLVKLVDSLFKTAWNALKMEKLALYVPLDTIRVLMAPHVLIVEA